jgi:hypothetical protein
MLASRGSLNKCKLQPFLQFFVSVAQAFGEVSSYVFVRGPQHGGGKAQAPGECLFRKVVGGWSKQEVDSDRYSSRNSYEKPYIEEPSCRNLALMNRSEQSERIGDNQCHDSPDRAQLACRREEYEPQ